MIGPERSILRLMKEALGRIPEGGRRAITITLHPDTCECGSRQATAHHDAAFISAGDPICLRCKMGVEWSETAGRYELIEALEIEGDPED